MFFENFQEDFNTLIAKSADLTNKPFLHSVVKISGDYEKNNEDIAKYKILMKLYDQADIINDIV